MNQRDFKILIILPFINCSYPFHISSPAQQFKNTPVRYPEFGTNNVKRKLQRLQLGATSYDRRTACRAWSFVPRASNNQQAQACRFITTHPRILRKAERSYLQSSPRRRLLPVCGLRFVCFLRCLATRMLVRSNVTIVGYG